MEYEGMSCEVVARGIKGATCMGTSGSMTAATAGTGAGAADFFFLVFLAFFLPPAMAPPRQQSRSPTRNSHCQTCKREPHEPEAAEELSAEPEESLAIDPVLKEPAEELPEPEEPALPRPEPSESNDRREPADETKEPEADEAEESLPSEDAEANESVEELVADPKAAKRAEARMTRIITLGPYDAVKCQNRC